MESWKKEGTIINSPLKALYHLFHFKYFSFKRLTNSNSLELAGFFSFKLGKSIMPSPVLIMKKGTITDSYRTEFWKLKWFPFKSFEF